MAGKSLGSILNRTTSATPPPPADEASTPSPQAATKVTKSRKAQGKKPEPVVALKIVEDKEVGLQFKVPDSIRRQLLLSAAQEGVTLRTIILRAIKQAGYDIPEEEIRDRRKS